MSQAPLVPSAELLRRVIDAECGYTASRLSVLERLPGNPVGVASRRVGEAYAFRARHLPISSFNRVVGLTDANAGDVGPLIAWFAEADVNGRFEIAPGGHAQAVRRALAAAGWAHSDFHATLFGAPGTAQNPAMGVSVEVVDAGTLEAFLDAYAAGWAVTEREGFKANVRGWLGQPGWTLYLGRHEGQPAGAAILHVSNGVGYCADSSVDPAMRRKGVHLALLHRRSADAAQAGCDLICAQAAFLSTSHRNMVRAGMALLYSQAMWTRAA
ncbi:MAG TPA: GNAT family N-acetyltransferase [Caulobacteraceae bacterium]